MSGRVPHTHTPRRGEEATDSSLLPPWEPGSGELEAGLELSTHWVGFPCLLASVSPYLTWVSALDGPGIGP